MDIIEQLERRDETAIELLKAHYGDYCYGIIYQQLRSREDTEEALKEALGALLAEFRKGN